MCIPLFRGFFKLNAIFNFFSGCSGEYLFTFYCVSPLMQDQENNCTTNLTISRAITVCFDGKHLVQSFLFSEETIPSIKDKSTVTDTFLDWLFGCPVCSGSWLTLSNCKFSCDAAQLKQSIGDKAKCFHGVTIYSLFELKSFK